MKIDASFPGGNIVVEQLGQNSVRLRQDLRDTEGDWFYWYFRASEAAGRTVRFHFTGSRAFAAHGPAISTDEGRNWRWLGQDAVEGNAFAYTFGSDEKTVLFSIAIPYTEAHWNTFLIGLDARRQRVETGTLCLSLRGRRVESVRFGCPSEKQEHRVVLTARHHACETMGSYVLEGLIAFVLSDDPLAQRLREKVEFLAFPFIDKDGVEAGDQGKNRRPHDHNRDYDQSLYPETAALRRLLPEWSRGNLHVALDLHCPWIAGGLNEVLYQVGSSEARIWAAQQQFGEMLERVQSGPLTYRASNDLPYGQDWNVAANYRQGKSFSTWIAERPEVRLASTFEIPYASASGGKVTSKSARAVGADLARALAAYLLPVA